MTTTKMPRGKHAQYRPEQGNGNGAPNMFTPQQLQNWDTDMEASNGDWVPARPLGWQGMNLFSLKRRLQYAWGVFTGRYDVLRWPQ